MTPVTIYHNPRCSKSRQTLQLLIDRGIEPVVVLYLETPPDVPVLRDIVTKLGIEPAALVRQKDRRALGLPETDDREELLQQMAANPQIIERPIVLSGTRARLGRPPEQVLEILDSDD